MFKNGFIYRTGTSSKYSIVGINSICFSGSVVSISLRRNFSPKKPE